MQTEENIREILQKRSETQSLREQLSKSDEERRRTEKALADVQARHASETKVRTSSSGCQVFSISAAISAWVMPLCMTDIAWWHGGRREMIACGRRSGIFRPHVNTLIGNSKVFIVPSRIGEANCAAMHLQATLMR